MGSLPYWCPVETMSGATKDEGCLFQYMVEVSSSSRGLLKIFRFLEWWEDDEDGDDGHGYIKLQGL